MNARDEKYGTTELDAEPSGAEMAAGGQGKGRMFPDSWGMPEGAPLSEEREVWVRSHVHRATITQRFTHLEAAHGRLLAIARNAWLDSIERTP